MAILSAGTLLALCIVATTLETVHCIGIPSGCDDGQNFCSCGDTGRTFSISYERCTYFYRWRPYCKECNEDIDFEAQCSQFRYCQACDGTVDGCVSCPSNRYGKWCDMTCDCQNNGQCMADGSCVCSDQFEGTKCEQRKAVYCPFPDIPHNSKLAENSIKYLGGTSVSVVCNPNYQLVGTSRLLCDFNGNWIGDPPKCEPICEALETPSGAVAIVTSVVPGTTVVRSILYDCLPGYKLQGSDRIDCTEDGTWSGTPPFCVAICGEPVPPKHGSVTWTGIYEGSRARYACEAGYIRNGVRERICGADQIWTQPSPICEPVNCGMPEIPEHGYLSATNFTYQGVVTFTCEETYVFIDPPEARICLYTGKWSGITPQCVKDVSCPDPGFVANSVRVADANVATFHAGDFITFSCSDSYKMVYGDDTRVCLATGSWSGEQPICVPETACADPGVPDYGIRHVEISPLALSAVKQRSSDRIRLTYSSVSSQQSESSGPSESDSISIQEESSVEPEPEQNEQEQLVNLLLEGYFLAGTHLTYRCKSNLYKLYGSSKLTCLNGEWSRNTPTCKPVCGKATGDKQAYVAGGNDTIAGQWPWHAALYQNTHGRRRLICGASILTDTLVLTAAHCVRERSSNRRLANTTYKVEVGKYYRLSHDRDQEWIQSINVTEIFVHYNYNPFTLEGDIAILRLERPMEFTARVRPVCLPSVSSTRRNLQPGNQGVLTGWGKTGLGLPKVLQQATIPVVSRLKCQHNYQEAYPDLHNIVVTRNMFCAGLKEGGVDSCTGDSGSPMVFSRGEGEMKSWYIEGIVSWGSPGGQCGLPNEFGVYTKVTKYLSWLNEFGISN